MPKISKRLVDSLRPDPSGKDRFVWDAGDGALKGFGIRIKKSGAAAYLVQYRNKEGRTRRLRLAQVGTLTPDQARDLATDRLREVAKGGDPSADRHRLREGLTVAELCNLYLEEAAAHVKASTLKMDKSRIEVHVKPLLGAHSAAGLTAEDIERMQSSIAAGKTAQAPKRDPETGKRIGRGGVAAGGRGVASRTVGMLGTILEFARGRKLIVENVARSVKRLQGGRQRRFLSPEELAALGKELRQAEAAAELAGESAAGPAAIRLLLMTGLRRAEALALPHAWVDGRMRCIRFEDTKSGAQMRPIGAEAVKLIEAQRVAEIQRRARAAVGRGMVSTPADVSPWVFPGIYGDGHLIGLPKILERLCDRAQLAGVTCHVLRHTFASVAEELGFSQTTIAGLLGHSVPGITARYVHVPDSALVAAADRVAARVAALMDGREESAEVVTLRPGSAR